jgi:FAD/FMN-containing dehydrogenase
VTEYAPTELVVTARAGTRLSELESLLASEGQMLAFEPPRFGAEATLGGAIAAGASGPRRPYAGAARDFVQMLPASGERRELHRVVSVTFGDSTAIGFVTRDDAGELGLGAAARGRIAVYFPMSYQIGGYMLLVPREHVEPLEIPIETAMRLVLTGGMSGAPAKP